MTVFRRPLFALGTTSVLRLCCWVLYFAHQLLTLCSLVTRWTAARMTCQTTAPDLALDVRARFARSAGRLALWKCGCYSKCFALRRTSVWVSYSGWWTSAGTFTQGAAAISALLLQSSESLHWSRLVRDKCHSSAPTTRTERYATPGPSLCNASSSSLEVEPRTSQHTLRSSSAAPVPEMHGKMGDLTNVVQTLLPLQGCTAQGNANAGQRVLPMRSKFSSRSRRPFI
jgi:hypothetical protein